MDVTTFSGFSVDFFKAQEDAQMSSKPGDMSWLPRNSFFKMCFILFYFLPVLGLPCRAGASLQLPELRLLCRCGARGPLVAVSLLLQGAGCRCGAPLVEALGL